MDLLDSYQVAGWLDTTLSLFAAVPAGLLLAALMGLASFGIFSLVRLFKSLL